ncbi:50S ribosomal protein L13 [Candidatus Woesearchaeota archaeon]|nr:50S ribosomal protein L13 [Candidatus Woesearchaeota archaeon]
MIINAENLILGRLATYAAKQALEGNPVIIVNCEKAIITGNKTSILNEFKEINDLGGPYKGPFLQKTPDKLVRRTIRGMLPYRQERGSKAFKRVKCFTGIPDKYQNQKIETIKEASYTKLNTLKFITVNDISRAYHKGVA